MRKLYYAPGIISLVGFLFLLPYSFKRIIPKKETTLKFNVPKKGGDLDQFAEESISKDISKKKKITFTLNENRETNRKKLEVVRYEARKLKYTLDTSPVILINFTTELSYGQFINLIDQCKQDSIRRYSILNNGFVIFGESPPRKVEPNGFECFLCNDVIHLPPPEKSFKEKLITAIRPYTNFQTIGLLTGWIILAVMSLYFMRKRALSSHPSSTP